MSDTPRHPDDFVQLCERALAAVEELRSAPAGQRASRIATLRALLERIGARMVELDLRSPHFPEEQASLADAASALLAVDLDRGGPRVPRLVDRIADDLRRLAGG
jgi:hypothetical protein